MALAPCASQFWEPAASRPTTADSRRSRKSFPSDSRRAGTRSPFTAGSAIRFTEYRGVKLVPLPTIRHKYFDTLAHTFLSTLHLLRASGGCGALLQRGQRRVHDPAADGGYSGRVERRWHRTQGGRNGMPSRGHGIGVRKFSRRSYPTGLSPTPRRSGTYYKERYNKDSLFIPYGAEAGRVETTAALEPLGLAPLQYFLYVSRMEPENRALEVRQAFEQVATADEAGADRRCASCRATTFARCAIRRTRGW